MDTLGTYRVFLSVVEQGGFSRAADHLQLSRASVSVAVQRLETALGTQLLHRSTRKVQLTQDGRAFYERARDLLDDMDELKNMFQQQDRSLVGRLRVDMTSGLAQTLVIPALPAFLDLHPGLTVEISGTDRRVDVVREGFDCVLRVGVLEDTSLVARPVGFMRMVNCASPAYVARHGLPQQLADLQRHRLVHFAGTLGQRAVGFEYVSNDGVVEVPMPSHVAVNNVGSYQAAALAGLGIVQVPMMGVRPLLARGDLVQVLPHFNPSPMPVTWLYAHRRHLPKRVRVFMDWVAELLEPHLEPHG